MITTSPYQSPIAGRRMVRVQTGKASLPELKRQMLAGKNVESAFSLLIAPVSPRNQTSFVAVEDGSRLLVGICVLECKRTILPHIEENPEPYQGNLEILFDLRNDGLGYCHYIFDANGKTFTNHYSPYPEARSSQWSLPRVAKWKFESQSAAVKRGYITHWLWVWFETKEVFQHGDVIGFNVCRNDTRTEEHSSWNFAAGFGFPDAQSLGFLCRGNAKPKYTPPAPSARAEKFHLTMLNDPPDTLIPEPYTPASLDAEMKTLKHWGFTRAEWIDYSNGPAFWERDLWKKNYYTTIANCPDLMREAATAAHRNGLEYMADVKLLDLSYQNFGVTSKLPGTLENWDGWSIVGVPEMEGQEEAFMQSNPAWRKTVQFPIRKIRFYSSTEIPAIRAKDLVISVSKSNKSYTTLKQRSFRVRVDRVRRQHRRWEPDGCHFEEGHFQNWMLEITCFDCQHPFLSIECKKPGLQFTNPAFLFVEAEDASGNITPVQITQSPRFCFAPGWQGWGPHDEWIVKHATWSFSPLGLAFIDPHTLPGMLEITHPSAHKIWLDRIQYLLDRGIDGISLRTLCHHNNTTSWRKYAFGPTVLDTFQKAYGRLPEATEDDYIKIRKIRGNALTELLREIRRRCKPHNQKILFQIETGAEMPEEIGNRMQIHYDYEQWMKEGLVDEFHCRAITSHSPWLLGYLLPLAKKHGVKVHIVTRNLSNGLEPQAVPVFDRAVKDAVEAGYDGFTFYETVGLYELTQEGVVIAKGAALPAIEASAKRAKLL